MYSTTLSVIYRSKNMRVIIILVLSFGLSVFSISTFAQGRHNNDENAQGRHNNDKNEAIYLITDGDDIICSYAPAKYLAAQMKTNNFGKSYWDPQGDEGLEVAFQLFLSSTDDCIDNKGWVAGFPDVDPLPHE